LRLTLAWCSYLSPERCRSYFRLPQNVCDGSPRTSQQRQERLGDAVGAEEVDGKVPLECGTIAEPS
jgi:hypothetical protein